MTAFVGASRERDVEAHAGLHVAAKHEPCPPKQASKQTNRMLNTQAKNLTAPFTSFIQPQPCLHPFPLTFSTSTQFQP